MIHTHLALHIYETPAGEDPTSAFPVLFDMICTLVTATVIQSLLHERIRLSEQEEHSPKERISRYMILHSLKAKRDCKNINSYSIIYKFRLSDTEKTAPRFEDLAAVDVQEHVDRSISLICRKVNTSSG